MSENADDRIKLKIDLNTGVIDIDAPRDAWDAAIAKTKELAEALDLTGRRRVGVFVDQAAPTQTPANAAAAEKPKARTRTGGGSSNRAGRIGSFEVVKNLLTEPQEIELRAFYAEKAPVEQGDQIMVALYKGELLLDRKDLSFNEIYTLMWLAGVKDLPKALDLALGRLADDQKVIRENNKFQTKFVGRQYVEELRPKAAA